MEMRHACGGTTLSTWSGCHLSEKRYQAFSSAGQELRRLNSNAVLDIAQPPVMDM
jgi:hypothetical protein